jgi:hypothetical protein
VAECRSGAAPTATPPAAACPDGGCAHAPNPGQTGTDPLVRDTNRRG